MYAYILHMPQYLIFIHFSPISNSSGQVFYNWKGQLRTRAKKLKQIQDGKTGVDDKLALQKLTDVEKRALKLWKEDFQDKDIASVSTWTCNSLWLRSFGFLVQCLFWNGEVLCEIWDRLLICWLVVLGFTWLWVFLGYESLESKLYEVWT